MFNFRDQVLAQYDEETYERIMELFDMLPVAAIVNNSYLSVHGGFSRDLQSLDAVNEFDRMIEPPEEGLMADFLWADPLSANKAKKLDYLYNEERGISFYFGKKPVNDFLESNGLKAIIRAHQVKE